jgi:hypothetical protein
MIVVSSIFVAGVPLGMLVDWLLRDFVRNRPPFHDFLASRFRLFLTAQDDYDLAGWIREQWATVIGWSVIAIGLGIDVIILQFNLGPTVSERTWAVCNTHPLVKVLGAFAGFAWTGLINWQNGNWWSMFGCAAATAHLFLNE